MGERLSVTNSQSLLRELVLACFDFDDDEMLDKFTYFVDTYNQFKKDKLSGLNVKNEFSKNKGREMLVRHLSFIECDSNKTANAFFTGETYVDNLSVNADKFEDMTVRVNNVLQQCKKAFVDLSISNYILEFHPQDFDRVEKEDANTLHQPKFQSPHFQYTGSNVALAMSIVEYVLAKEQLLIRQDRFQFLTKYNYFKTEFKDGVITKIGDIVIDVNDYNLEASVLSQDEINALSLQVEQSYINDEQELKTIEEELEFELSDEDMAVDFDEDVDDAVVVSCDGINVQNDLDRLAQIVSDVLDDNDVQINKISEVQASMSDVLKSLNEAIKKTSSVIDNAIKLVKKR